MKWCAIWRTTHDGQIAGRQCSGWATCPLTENGLIRIVFHPSYPNLRLSPAGAAESLALFKAGFPGSYCFWPDSISLADSTVFDLAVLTG